MDTVIPGGTYQYSPPPPPRKNKYFVFGFTACFAITFLHTHSWLRYSRLQTRERAGYHSLHGGSWEGVKSIPRRTTYHGTIGCMETPVQGLYLRIIYNRPPSRSPTKSPFTTCRVRVSIITKILRPFRIY